jgi:hypothetical protein
MLCEQMSEPTAHRDIETMGLRVHEARALDATLRAMEQERHEDR